MKRVHTICRQLAAVPCSSESKGKPALDGIRVVELSMVLAAPLCGAMLADYGAEVIKIEDPKSPDVVRSWGRGDDPGKTADPAVHATVEGGGSSFVQLNRGKKSIGLDPTSVEGKKVFKELLRNADVFITNVRLKSLRKAGLDYESLKAEFPTLIYAHLTAYGRDGAMADDPGYDFGAFWAQTGMMDLCRTSDDAPMPREPGGIGDYTTGNQMLGGIFAALYHREKTGQGQLVDASLMRAGIWALGQALVANMGGNDWATGKRYVDDQPVSFAIRGTAEVGKRSTFTTKTPFKCKCGTWVQLLGNDVGRHFPKMPKLLGVPDETLYGTDMRNIDWAASNRVADAIFAQKSFEEWEPLMREHDVWYKVVHKFEDQLDPSSTAYQQAQAAGSYTFAPGISRHNLMAAPVQLSAMSAIPRGPAPKFGQHTEEVLKDLGMPPEKFYQLKEQGVVAVSKGTRRKKKPTS